MKKKYISIIALILCFCVLPAFSSEVNSLNLKTVSTEHFRIIFPISCSFTAQKIYENCEDIYASLVEEFGEDPDLNIPVVITDKHKTTNAFYTAYPSNRITVYDFANTEPSLFFLSDSYLSIFRHELVHAFNFNLRSPFWDFMSTVFGDGLGSAHLLYENRFFTEGLAVFMESRNGYGRLNDPTVIQILRQAKLDDTFPSWSDVSSIRDIYPSGNYNYIFSGAFFQFLSDTYGEEKFLNFFKEAEHLNLGLTNELFTKIFGKRPEKIWNDFKDSIPDVIISAEVQPVTAENSIYSQTMYKNNRFYALNKRTGKLEMYSDSGKKVIITDPDAINYFDISDGNDILTSHIQDNECSLYLYNSKGNRIATLKSDKEFYTKGCFTYLNSVPFILAVSVKENYTFLTIYDYSFNEIKKVCLGYDMKIISLCNMDNSMCAFILSCAGKDKICIADTSTLEYKVLDTDSKIIIRSLTYTDGVLYFTYMPENAQSASLYSLGYITFGLEETEIKLPEIKLTDKTDRKNIIPENTEPEITEPVEEKETEVTEELTEPETTELTEERETEVTEEPKEPEITEPIEERETEVTEEQEEPENTEPTEERETEVTEEPKEPEITEPTEERETEVTEEPKEPEITEPTVKETFTKEKSIDKKTINKGVKVKSLKELKYANIYLSDTYVSGGIFYPSSSEDGMLFFISTHLYGQFVSKADIYDLNFNKEGTSKFIDGALCDYYSECLELSDFIVSAQQYNLLENVPKGTILPFGPSTLNSSLIRNYELGLTYITSDPTNSFGLSGGFGYSFENRFFDIGIGLWQSVGNTTFNESLNVLIPLLKPSLIIFDLNVSLESYFYLRNNNEYIRLYNKFNTIFGLGSPLIQNTLRVSYKNIHSEGFNPFCYSGLSASFQLDNLLPTIGVNYNFSHVLPVKTSDSFVLNLPLNLGISFSLLKNNIYSLSESAEMVFASWEVQRGVPYVYLYLKRISLKGEVINTSYFSDTLLSNVVSLNIGLFADTGINVGSFLSNLNVTIGGVFTWDNIYRNPQFKFYFDLQ